MSKTENKEPTNVGSPTPKKKKKGGERMKWENDKSKEK